MNNPTTPASVDELSDVRLLELAAETDLARDYDGSGYVESTCREGADITASVLAFARAVIAADRAARPATGVPAGWRLVPDSWQAEPGLQRHAFDAADRLSKYAAAPFFPNTEVRGVVRSTSADWWDGLAELIEEAQPLIARAMKALSEPIPAAPASPLRQAQDGERAIWCKHCGEGTVPGYCRLRKSQEIMPMDCAARSQAEGGKEDGNGNV